MLLFSGFEIVCTFFYFRETAFGKFFIVDHLSICLGFENAKVGTLAIDDFYQVSIAIKTVPESLTVLAKNK